MKSLSLLVAALLASADALPDKTHNAYAPILAARQEIGVQQPTKPPMLGKPTDQGCFKSAGELEFNTTLQWNSIGECAGKVCLNAGYPVAGTMGGNQCWCGHTYPPKEDTVDDNKCNVGCTGYDQHACGGIKFWSIYNTGVTLAVDYLGEEEEDEKTSTTAPASTSTSAAPTNTASVTETPTAEPSGGGTNVAGIVAGVVVGVVVFTAVLAGGFLYMRKKRNQEIEEEHRRNAAVNAFIGKPPGSSGGLSMTDSRLDPVMAHRRMSDGSIADNHDYSRKILRVTNA